MIIGGKRKGSIVGISHYTSLQKLDFCKKDGQEIYELLSPIGYEISENNKLTAQFVSQNRLPLTKSVIYIRDNCCPIISSWTWPLATITTISRPNMPIVAN